MGTLAPRAGVRPHFFIVGAPRCGTSALCRYLGEHPEVFVPADKEPCFFGTDLIRAGAEAPSPEAYRSLFDEAGDRICGEGSTWYLLSERAAREIHEYNPDARIMIHVRDPVELLQSAHKQGIYNGHEDIDSLLEAMAAEPDRRAGRRIPKSCRLVSTLFYSSLVSFTANLRRYLEVFDRDRVRIVVYDDLRADTRRVYRETLEFLGVDPTFETDFRRVNANKELRSARVQRFLKAPPSWIGRPLDSLPGGLGAKARRWALRRNARYAKRRPLDPRATARLRRQFTPEVEKLSELLGRDLTHWSRE